MTKQVRLKMELPKLPDIELLAVEGLTRMAEFLGVYGSDINAAQIMTMEAVINAFEHADGVTGQVQIEFIMSKEKLTVLVVDDGKGFDPESVENPNIEEKIGSKNKRGWGLKIMRSISDEFHIATGKHGTQIRLVKILEKEESSGRAV